MKTTTAPNILLVMTDQQSADTTSLGMGHVHIRTPAIDRLAASGVRFNRAYCAHPLCVPSRTSMFTGRYPHETGILTNRDLARDVSAFPCLGVILKAAGYDTGYIGKWHLPYPLNHPDLHGFSFQANNICNGADRLNSRLAAEFLQAQRDAPFFLVVSYNNPHNICEWARGARGAQLTDGALANPPALESLPPLRPNRRPQIDEPDALRRLRQSYQASAMFPVGSFGDREWREYLWAYYRMIECVDGHIAVLMETLEAAGLSENTLVIFLSDHGDAQGAHLWNQKTTLYDESARVPCILSYPARIPPGISDVLVQTGIDLAPTLCDAAGIASPPDLPGRSLLEAVSKATPGQERPYIVTQTRFVQGAPLDGTIPDVSGRMVRGQRYKYCVYDAGAHRESLVDMDQDPGETTNLAGKRGYAPVLAEYRRYLQEFCDRTADEFLKTA